MKRILAILILIFMVVLHATNIANAISYETPSSIQIVQYRTKPLFNVAPAKKAPAKEEPAKIEVKAEIKTEIKTEKNEAETKKEKNAPDSMVHHRATWYKTEGTRVHREHPTAAYNLVPKGTMLLVTNLANQKSCIVEVTDRMGKSGRHFIDLSHSAFGYLANHSTGAIKVVVKILEQ